MLAAMPVKPKRPAAAAARSARPVLRFRMRVTAGDTIAVGPGKVALLEAIASTGSLTAAAKLLDMSYRRAWLLVEKINAALTAPAVAAATGGRQGGGAAITPVGREVITLYRAIESAAHSSAREQFRAIGKLMRERATPAAERGRRPSRIGRSR